jgi:hypothetical protein
MLNFHEISRICRSWKFSAGAGVFFPGAGVEFFWPEPEVKNPEFAQH